MQVQDFNLLAKRLLALDADATTEMSAEPMLLDAARFTDPVRHDAERRALFVERPQLFAFSSDLPEPGSFVTEDLAGIPVLVVRDDEGVVRAFRNACRHRGMKVVEGCGQARRFTCPYHAWVYDRIGRLTGIPFAEAFEGASLDEGLPELPAAEAHGLIFVQPSPGPAFDPDDYLCGLGSELASFRIGESLRVGERWVRPACNWKLANDAGFEQYHVRSLHKNTVGDQNISNLAAMDWWGLNHRMSIASPTLRDLRDRAESEWDAAEHLILVYNVFPSAAMVVSTRLIAFVRIEPGDGPGNCVVRFRTYSPVPLDDPDMAALAELAFEGLYHIAANEDFVATASIQENLACGAMDHLVIGRNELGVQQVHRNIDGLLESRSAASASQE